MDPGPTSKALPSLFCWSRMMTTSQEVELLRLQLVKRASIFACDSYAVISDGKYLLGNIDGNYVWTWKNPAPKAVIGKNGVDGATTDSYLNTESFLNAWDSLITSGLMW